MGKGGTERQQRGIKDNPHTDRGWAWVVLLAAFLETYLLLGCHSSFGIYYKEFLAYFNTSASTISFALSVQTAFISAGSLLVMSVGEKFCSTRIFVMLGGLTGCTAYMLNSFAPNAAFLMLSQGVFYGSTHALCHGPMLLTLGRYFHKRRGLATTLSSIGSSISGLTMPVLTRFLIDQYGLQGSLMFISGLLLNLMVAGALLRPVVANKPKVPENDKDMETDKLSPDLPDEKVAPNDHEFIVDRERGEITLYIAEKAGSTSQLHVHYDRLLPEPVERMRTYSSSHVRRHDKPAVSPNTLKTSSTSSVHRMGHLHLHKLLTQLTASTGDITGGSALSVGSLGTNVHRPNHQTTDDHRDHSADDTETQTTTSCSRSFKTILSHVFDKKVIGNRLFQMFLPVAFFAIIGCAQTITFVPPHSADIGLTNEEVSYLFLISGSADTVCKLFFAAISDCHFIQRYRIVALNLTLTGLVVNFVSLFTDFKSMILLALANGMFGQIYFGLFPVILADFVGIENLSPAIGMVLLTHGIALSISNPLLGYIRDVTGSFVGSFHFMATSQMIGGLILFSTPIFRKMEERRKEKQRGGS